MSVLPYYFIPEMDNNRQVTIKRKNGGIVAGLFRTQYRARLAEGFERNWIYWFHITVD